MCFSGARATPAARYAAALPHSHLPALLQSVDALLQLAARGDVRAADVIRIITAPGKGPHLPAPPPRGLGTWGGGGGGQEEEDDDVDMLLLMEEEEEEAAAAGAAAAAVERAGTTGVCHVSMTGDDDLELLRRAEVDRRALPRPPTPPLLPPPSSTTTAVGRGHGTRLARPPPQPGVHVLSKRVVEAAFTAAPAFDDAALHAFQDSDVEVDLSDDEEEEVAEESRGYGGGGQRSAGQPPPSAGGATQIIAAKAALVAAVRGGVALQHRKRERGGGGAGVVVPSRVPTHLDATAPSSTESSPAVGGLNGKAWVSAGDKRRRMVPSSAGPPDPLALAVAEPEVSAPRGKPHKAAALAPATNTSRRSSGRSSGAVAHACFSVGDLALYAPSPGDPRLRPVVVRSVRVGDGAGGAPPVYSVALVALREGAPKSGAWGTYNGQVWTPRHCAAVHGLPAAALTAFLAPSDPPQGRTPPSSSSTSGGGRTAVPAAAVQGGRRPPPPPALPSSPGGATLPLDDEEEDGEEEEEEAWPDSPILGR